MVTEYERHDEEMELPKGSGIPGLLRAIGEIARLPRVQQIVIQSNGKIEYSFHLRKGDKPKELQINFEDIMPYAIARNGSIEELPYPSSHAATACGELFQRAAKDHVYPVAMLAGADTDFWRWYRDSTNLDSADEELFGLPFLRDRMLDDRTLLLCTAYKRNATITDVVRSYKITIPVFSRVVQPEKVESI